MRTVTALFVVLFTFSSFAAVPFSSWSGTDLTDDNLEIRDIKVIGDDATSCAWFYVPPGEGSSQERNVKIRKDEEHVLAFLLSMHSQGKRVKLTVDSGNFAKYVSVASGDK